MPVIVDNTTDKKVDDTTQVVKPAAEVTSDTTKTDTSASDTKTDTVPLATLLATKDKLKEAEGKLKLIDDEKKIADQKKLEDDGKFQEIIIEKDKRITELELPANEGIKWKADKVAELKKVMGDNWNEEYGNMSLSALEKLSITLKLTSAKVPTDDGDGIQKQGDLKNIKLSDAEQKEADEMGLTKEAYYTLQQSRKKNLEKK